MKILAIMIWCDYLCVFYLFSAPERGTLCLDLHYFYMSVLNCQYCRLCLYFLTHPLQQKVSSDEFVFDVG